MGDSVNQKPKSNSHICYVSDTQNTGGRKKKGGDGDTMNVECITDDNAAEFFGNTKQAVAKAKAAKAAATGATGASGGADIKSKYKKTLNKKTLEDLRKMAKGKGIKITTKKDGKSVYLKKSSIINKLCNFKHPKKPVKKPVKKTIKKTTKRK